MTFLHNVFLFAYTFNSVLLLSLKVFCLMNTIALFVISFLSLRHGMRLQSCYYIQNPRSLALIAQQLGLGNACAGSRSMFVPNTTHGTSHQSWRHVREGKESRRRLIQRQQYHLHLVQNYGNSTWKPTSIMLWGITYLQFVSMAHLMAIILNLCVFYLLFVGVCNLTYIRVNLNTSGVNDSIPSFKKENMPLVLERQLAESG